MAANPQVITFETFMAEVQEPGTPLISPERFADKLDLEQQALARLAGVHRNTIRRHSRSPQLQKFLIDAVRVIKAATDVSGDANKALFWYRTHPISEFGYKTPETVVSEGRVEDVLKYIDTIQGGAAG